MQLFRKGLTNSPSSLDSLQPIHQRKTCGVSKTFTCPNNAAPRKHGRNI